MFHTYSSLLSCSRERMYDDYAPIIWAQCKHKHEGLQGYCAYIRVPTIHKEIQDAGDRGPDDPENTHRSCVGGNLLENDEGNDLIQAFPESNSSSPSFGLSLQQRESNQPIMKDDNTIAGSTKENKVPLIMDECEQNRRDTKEELKEVFKELPDKDKAELCRPPEPEKCKDSIRYITTSNCQTQTKVIRYDPGETSQLLTAYTPCGCPNHVTYIPRTSEGVPDITCTCDPLPTPRVDVTTLCTTSMDPDFIRRYLHSYLRNHPHRQKILSLATAIEKRRIEGYNFWDPKTLRLFVKKYVKGHPKKAIFMLGGGPGKTGFDLECLVENYVCWLKNNFVIYLIHHRGTGNSSRIPSGVSLADSMINPDIYISEMYHPFFAFTVSNAALDVYNVFQREKLETHHSQIKWYVHSCSYGTLVAQRLMLLKPDELDGVILDGVISPNPNVSRSLLDFGHRNNEILKNCMKNDYCRKQIKSIDKYLSTFKRGEAKKTRCARFLAGMFPDDKSYIGFIRSVMNYYFEKNEVVGVQFGYALGHCPNYSHFVQFVQRNLACWMAYVRCDPVDLHPIVYSLIMQSEIVGKRMLIHDARYRELNTITCSRDLVRMGRKSFSRFNYMLDRRAHEYSFNRRTPVLILQGRLDGVTPVDNATDVYQKSNSKLTKMVVFENEGHTVSCSGNPCLETIIKEFYDVPMPLDTLPSAECMRQHNMTTLNWEGWEYNLWNGWDWLFWLLFWLLILVLILLLILFIYRRLRR